MISKLFSYVVIGFLFAVPIILYKRLYFKRVTFVRVLPDGSTSCVSLKPYKGLTQYFNCSFFSASVGHNLIAFCPDISDANLGLSGVRLSCPILICSVKRGRLVSVDLNSRSFIDSISKFSIKG